MLESERKELLREVAIEVMTRVTARVEEILDDYGLCLHPRAKAELIMFLCEELAEGDGGWEELFEEVEEAALEQSVR